MDAIVGTEQLVNVPGGRRDPSETCREHGADRVAAFGRIHIPGKCREITPGAVRFEEIENPVDVVAIESRTECRDPCLDGRYRVQFCPSALFNRCAVSRVPSSRPT